MMKLWNALMPEGQSVVVMFALIMAAAADGGNERDGAGRTAGAVQDF